METLRKYLLPGLIFQSVIVGGGYATGRELVEFFLPSGPIGGVIGLVVAGLVFGVVMAAAYEFARVMRTFDYRTFTQKLLGPAWVVYEIAFIATVVLVLAVLGSASGELVASSTGAPPIVGTMGMLLLVALLTFYGSALIQRVLAGWSVLLYLVYIVLFVVTFATFGDRIDANYVAADAGEGWLSGGVRYAGYNINPPAVLFCLVILTRRREAIGAGLLTGALAIIPALFFYVAMMAHYPEIGLEAVPALHMMAQLNIPWLQVIFHIVVFGTFVETGAGFLHAVNERIDHQVKERGYELPRYARPLLAGGLMVLSIYGATAIGIVDLIAKGYGALAYVFIIVLIIPLLTVGVWKIYKASRVFRIPYSTIR